MAFKHKINYAPDQTQNNAIFDRPDVLEANCIVGSLKYPDTKNQIDFERNKYNDVYNEMRRFYKDFIGRQGTPYISYKDFKELYPCLFYDLEITKGYS